MRSDKILATNLRKRGYSYNLISRELGIPKSTISGWFKELHYSKLIRQKLTTQAAQKAADNINRWNKLRKELYIQNRNSRIKKISQTVPTLNKENLFFLGLALFWAEGSKKERFSVRFANSDPNLIKLWRRFLIEICEVPTKKIRVSVHLHPYISDKEAKKFWTKIIDIPGLQFNKSQVKLSVRSQRKRPPNTLPYGTCHIYVGSSQLKQKIDGWMEGIRQQIKVA